MHPCFAIYLQPNRIPRNSHRNVGASWNKTTSHKMRQNQQKSSQELYFALTLVVWFAEDSVWHLAELKQRRKSEWCKKNAWLKGSKSCRKDTKEAGCSYVGRLFQNIYVTSKKIKNEFT